MTNLDVAKAFSGHDFELAFDHLAEDVTWNVVGDSRIEGRDGVVAACRATADGNEDVTTTWLRFVTTADGDVVAVDAIAHYDGPEGAATVSSCDIYEFAAGTIQAITSYTVLVDP